MCNAVTSPSSTCRGTTTHSRVGARGSLRLTTSKPSLAMLATLRYLLTSLMSVSFFEGRVPSVVDARLCGVNREIPTVWPTRQCGWWAWDDRCHCGLLMCRRREHDRSVHSVWGSVARELSWGCVLFSRGWRPWSTVATVGKLLAFLRWGHQSAVPMYTRSQEVRRLVMRLLEIKLSRPHGRRRGWGA